MMNVETSKTDWTTLAQQLVQLVLSNISEECQLFFLHFGVAQL